MLLTWLEPLLLLQDLNIVSIFQLIPGKKSGANFSHMVCSLFLEAARPPPSPVNSAVCDPQTDECPIAQTN